MVKVEAVVIRERVETVIDAVEEETGHVGVTVVEAIGHGRQRGSRTSTGPDLRVPFLPKAMLVFVVRRQRRGGLARRSCDAARSGNESGDGIAWTTPVDAVTHNRTGTRSRRWRSDDTADLTIAASTVWVVVAAVLVMFMQAGFAFLEAGPHTHEERRTRRREERARVRASPRRLLPRRVRARVRGRRRRLRRRIGLLPVDRRPPLGREGTLQWFSQIPAPPATCSRSCSRRLAGDRLGGHGGAHEALGVLRLRRRLHDHLLDRLALDLEP